MGNSKLIKQRSKTTTCFVVLFYFVLFSLKTALLGRKYTRKEKKTDDRETTSGVFIMARAGDVVAQTVVLALSMDWRL